MYIYPNCKKFLTIFNDLVSSLTSTNVSKKYYETKNSI